MKLHQAIVNNARILSPDNPHKNQAWVDAAEKRAKRIADALPSGSGFDCGTKIESADDSRIVFSTSFHHMDENGFYDGWTEHKVTIRASLAHGFMVSVSGRNKNDIKTYIADVFNSIMSADFEWMNPQ